MSPPPVLPFRPVAAFGALLLTGGLTWALVAPTSRALVGADGACRLVEEAVWAPAPRAIDVRGARAVSRDAARWVAVVDTADGELLLRTGTQAEAEALIGPVALWVAGGRKGPLWLTVSRGPAAYGLPVAVAALGIALLALAGLLAPAGRAAGTESPPG
jgi:hypothetical protein